jgi:glutamyl-tRNA reductase
VIVALRRSLLGLGAQELRRLRGRMGPLSEAQERGIEELTRALMHKLLHRPVVHLRRAVERGDVEATLRLYRAIFDLDLDLDLDLDARARPAADEGDDDGPPGPRRLLKGGKD